MDTLTLAPPTSPGVVAPSYQVQQVLVPALMRVWPKAEPLIAAAVTRSHAWNITTPHWLLAGCLEQRCQLWVAHCGDRVDGCAISKIVEWDIPGNRTLYVPIVGGVPHTMKDWQAPMMAALKGFKVVNNCMDIRGEFRKGWGLLGFREIGVLLMLDEGTG